MASAQTQPQNLFPSCFLNLLYFPLLSLINLHLVPKRRAASGSLSHWLCCFSQHFMLCYINPPVNGILA